MKKFVVLLFSVILIISMHVTPSYATENNTRNIYIVKPGDSLRGVANKYGTTVENLKVTNGLQTNTLVSGQKLKVPITYRVVAGDTIQKLSSAYGISAQTIKTTNKLSSEGLLVGQKLKISPKRMNMQGQYILMTREEFRNWLLNNRFNRKIRLIQQHHTWAPSYKHFNGSNHFKLLIGMENYHVEKKKWKNIAQNITTFPDGKIAISRPFNLDPEGSIGPRANSGAIMIENVGNFDRGQDVMTMEQKETIVYITALLSIKFGLTPSIDTITYHHWWDMKTGERVLDKGYAVKTCPGTGFFGGNSTNSAKNYFYPQVSRKMQEIRASIR
jgi:LysM repeat protein